MILKKIVKKKQVKNVNSMNRNSMEKLFKEFNLTNNKHPIKTMRYHFAHHILKILMMKFSWKWTICKQLLEKHIDTEFTEENFVKHVKGL